MCSEDGVAHRVIVTDKLASYLPAIKRAVPSAEHRRLPIQSRDDLPNAVTRAAAKKFIKPIPHDELRREIDLFCELFTRPAVMAALKKFVESTDAMPYLP